MFLRVASETLEEKRQRLAAQRAHKEMRAAKLERTRYKGAHDDVELANIFQGFGLLSEFLKDRKEAFLMIRAKLEGRKLNSIYEKSMGFLRENFDFEKVEDSDGRKLLHFTQPKGEKGSTDMKLHTQVAEHSGQPRKVVKAVYDGLVRQIHISLKADRGIRLPEIGKIAIRYRPAKPKRKGMNPFTQKEQWFKAKAASNKIRFSPAKDLKRYVEKKIAVSKPKKHRK